MEVVLEKIIEIQGIKVEKVLLELEKEQIQRKH